MFSNLKFADAYYNYNHMGQFYQYLKNTVESLFKAYKHIMLVSMNNMSPTLSVQHVYYLSYTIQEIAYDIIRNNEGITIDDDPTEYIKDLIEHQLKVFNDLHDNSDRFNPEGKRTNRITKTRDELDLEYQDDKYDGDYIEEMFAMRVNADPFLEATNDSSITVYIGGAYTDAEEYKVASKGLFAIQYAEEELINFGCPIHPDPKFHQHFFNMIGTATVLLCKAFESGLATQYQTVGLDGIKSMLLFDYVESIVKDDTLFRALITIPTVDRATPDIPISDKTIADLHSLITMMMPISVVDTDEEIEEGEDEEDSEIMLSESTAPNNYITNQSNGKELSGDSGNSSVTVMTMDSDGEEGLLSFLNRITSSLNGKATSIYDNNTVSDAIEGNLTPDLMTYYQHVKSNIEESYILQGYINACLITTPNLRLISERFKEWIDASYTEFYNIDNKSAFANITNAFSPTNIIFTLTTNGEIIDMFVCDVLSDGEVIVPRIGDSFKTYDTLKTNYFLKVCRANTKNRINLNISSVSGQINFDLGYLATYLDCNPHTLVDDVMLNAFDITKFVLSLIYDIFVSEYISRKNCPGEHCAVDYHMFRDHVETYDFNTLLSCMEKYIEEGLLNEKDIDDIIRVIENDYETAKLGQYHKDSNMIGMNLFSGTSAGVLPSNPNEFTVAYCKNSSDKYLIEPSTVFALERYRDSTTGEEFRDNPDRLIVIDNIGDTTYNEFNKDLMSICKYLKSTIKKEE